MKLDILAFAAHPDDIELSCGGTLIKEIQNGNEKPKRLTRKVINEDLCKL